MEETKGSADSQAPISDLTEKQDDMVKYDTYRRVLGEKKKADGLLKEKDEIINQYKQKELEATGQQEKLIASLREEIAKRDQLLKKKDADYAWKTVSSEIREAAAKEQCTNVDVLLTQLSNDGSLEALQVNEDFSVNQDDLKRVIEGAKNKYAGINLFKSGSVNVNNVPLEAKKPVAKQKPISEMTAAEMKAAYAKLNGL